MTPRRTVSIWHGGSSPFRAFTYRLVEEAGVYTLEVKLTDLPDDAYAPVERYQHAAAQRMAGHERLDDLERLEWRRRRKA